MAKETHRLGVAEANLVVRRLKIEAYIQESLTQAINEIDQLYGIDGVSFEKDSKELQLAYDASRLDIDAIERILKDNRVEVSQDWWTLLKEGYYRFVDQNVKDNANSQPHCCSKIPPEAKRK